nr:DUF317 domain-containing protein [Catenulispora acidiphila]
MRRTPTSRKYCTSQAWPSRCTGPRGDHRRLRKRLRPRAGSGEHQTAFAPFKQPGWTCYEDDSGDNSTWVSPDRELSVEFGPEADAPHIAPLWRIAYRNPDPYRRTENSFAAYFDGHVPSEAIAAFITALTAPSTRPTDTGNEEH